MKKFASLLTLIAMGVLIVNPVEAQQQKKKTIAVLNFVKSGGVDKDEISILTDRFNNFLVNTNVYKVLEREKMDAILKEQDFTMTDNCNSAECAVQIGQLLGMDLMIAGKIGKFGTMYTLDIRIIDVSTGEILRTKSENYKGEKEGLLDMVEALAYTIAGLTAPLKKTETTTGKMNTDDTDDEITIGTLTKSVGSLDIECELDGVLYIDEKEMGEVSSGTTIPVEKLTEGKHEVKIIHTAGEFVENVNIEYNKKTLLMAGINIFKDYRDGKKYKIVKIGDQVWMAENLNYQTDNGSWCIDEKYGRLYDWEAAKKAVPSGWQLPSKKDFETLLKNLISNGANPYEEIIPGGSSGFNALLGGYRGYNGTVYGKDEYACLWSITEEGNDNAYKLIYKISSKTTDLYDISKKYAFSVRCIKESTSQIKGGRSSGSIKTDDNQRNKKTFTTNEVSTFTDPRDGRTYTTVKIGNQVWMAENLNYDAGKGSCCYDNDTSNCFRYGRLYDWKTAKRVVPPGWHLPSKEEFETLLKNLGGNLGAGGRDTYKQMIRGGSSGFNLQFAGYRYVLGTFSDAGKYQRIWTSTEIGNEAWHMCVDAIGESVHVRGTIAKKSVLSIRLVKN